MKRSILLTGCSSGIGLHAARHLSAHGWHVMAAARQSTDVDRLQAEGLNSVQLDYEDPASIEAAMDHTLALTGGRLDALFNNGAYGQVGALEDMATDLLRAQFEANFFGWHTLTRKVLPVMRAQGHGHIIQCSSVLGFVGAPYRGPYNATKHAIEGYSDTLRAEVARFGIKVVSIQPGPITSQFRDNARIRFEATIDPKNTAYADDYESQLQRLRSHDRSRFELGPEAVTRVLVKALQSTNPNPVYHVTMLTRLLAIAKRALPARALAMMMERARDA